MVADNKKEPATDSSEKASSTVVGGESQSQSSNGVFNTIGRHKVRTALVIAAVLLLVGWLHFGLHVGEKVYAHAAGHNIYKSDIDRLTENAPGVSDRQAATVLANKYLVQAMAKQAGITVTDKDMVAQYGSSILAQKKNNPYVYQSDINGAYFNQLLAYNSGLYKGKLLVAHFSRYIAVPSPFLSLHQAEVPNIGNSTAIAVDQHYAQNFITDLYNQVKSGKITFDQAIEEERSNPQLGAHAYQTLPHSGSFDTSNVYLSGTTLVAPKSIQPKLASMKAGQMSAPFAVQVSSTYKGKTTKFDSYYIVVRMDYTKGSHSGLTYNQYLAQAKQKYGYKVYV